MAFAIFATGSLEPSTKLFNLPSEVQGNSIFFFFLGPALVAKMSSTWNVLIFHYVDIFQVRVPSHLHEDHLFKKITTEAPQWLSQLSVPLWLRS